jgi:circadian clock protein KaiC
MRHSNQVREFVIEDTGVNLLDVYLGPDGILTGSARESHRLQEETGQLLHTNALDLKDRELQRKRKVLESKIDSLRTEFESTEEELNKIYTEEKIKKDVISQTREKMTSLRHSAAASGKEGANN